MCCGCDTSYIVSVHIQCQASIYTLFVSMAFMVGVASQTGDTDSTRAPGLTSGLQGSVNVHRGALLLLPQWQCISSFVFYNLIWGIVLTRFTLYASLLLGQGRLWVLNDSFALLVMQTFKQFWTLYISSFKKLRSNSDFVTIWYLELLFCNVRIL